MIIGLNNFEFVIVHDQIGVFQPLMACWLMRSVTV